MGIVVNPYLVLPAGFPGDAFDDNSINTSLWAITSPFGGAGSSIAEANNRLEITPTANTAGYSQIRTIAHYDFSNKTLKWNRISSFGDASTDVDAGVYIFKDSDNYILYGEGGGASLCRVRSAGSNSDSATGFYAWWKLKIVGTTLTFESSDDDVTYTVRKTVTLSWTPNVSDVIVYAGYYGTGNSSTTKGAIKNMTCVNSA